MNLKTLQTLLIDGDGVLWRGDEPINGLQHFFAVLEERGIRWGLLTNNSTRTLDEYVSKFARFGIHATREQVFSSASVTAAWLAERFDAGTPLYIIGESGLRETLTEAGFVVHEGEEQPEQVAAVVVGLDRQVTYARLAVATHLIRGGAPFIGTNPDRTLPTPAGLVPGSGSLLAALEAATDVRPTIIGKPEPTMYRQAMERFHADPETTAMLGDRLETDVLGGQRAGIGTILVLSGATRREMLNHSDVQPDLVFEDIAALAEELERAAALQAE